MRKAVKYNPVDLDNNIRVGISLPFDGKSVFNSTYTSAQQLKHNLINLLLTDKGERFFNLDFGIGLRSLLFENINDLEPLEESIKEDIVKYEPNIIINELSLTRGQANDVYLYIDYSSETDMKKDSINLTFEYNN